jgi:hypothetical protein
LFEFSKIIVSEVYPEMSRIWVIYDRKPDGQMINEKKSYIPISLYDAKNNQFSFGMLNVTIYS